MEWKYIFKKCDVSSPLILYTGPSNNAQKTFIVLKITVTNPYGGGAFQYRFRLQIYAEISLLLTVSYSEH